MYKRFNAYMHAFVDDACMAMRDYNLRAHGHTHVVYHDSSITPYLYNLARPPTSSICTCAAWLHSTAVFYQQTIYKPVMPRLQAGAKNNQQRVVIWGCTLPSIFSLAGLSGLISY